MSNIDVKKIDSITVAKVTIKHIASDDDVHSISREIKELLSDVDDKRIILNMEKVEVMASLMVGELIMLQKVFQKNSATLRLCSLNPTVVESLRITGICDLLPIDEDEESSLAQILA